MKKDIKYQNLFYEHLRIELNNYTNYYKELYMKVFMIRNSNRVLCKLASSLYQVGAVGTPKLYKYCEVYYENIFKILEEEINELLNDIKEIEIEIFNYTNIIKRRLRKSINQE
ncbi:hypothetical protein TCON_2406 [Astathelohania contejeani]|uniref:Uncharacterized protein n=1 Tax=Astathelohania contejeani TaxID=164912 RepID=A0ABQ7HW76_9MICR|nr:hypothetical protein TCON_2406 [Thelohania contejeani]